MLSVVHIHFFFFFFSVCLSVSPLHPSVYFCLCDPTYFIGDPYLFSQTRARKQCNRPDSVRKVNHINAWKTNGEAAANVAPDLLHENERFLQLNACMALCRTVSTRITPNDEI